MIGACGVLCSLCPAYHASAKGIEHQRRVAAAWRRIFGRGVPAERISCGGCTSPDAELLCTSRACRARRCCLANGYTSCAQCAVEWCPDLEKAQAAWDDVPALAHTLSRADFATYARPYCGHRERLAVARAARQQLGRDSTP